MAREAYEVQSACQSTITNPPKDIPLALMHISGDWSRRNSNSFDVIWPNGTFNIIAEKLIRLMASIVRQMSMISYAAYFI